MIITRKQALERYKHTRIRIPLALMKGKSQEEIRKLRIAFFVDYLLERDIKIDNTD
jgi:hypothetical protein